MKEPLTLKTAQGLSSYVHNKDFLFVLEEYVQDRVSFLQSKLESAADFESVRKLQGSIEEIRRLSHLYETVKQRIEDEKTNSGQ